MSKVKQQQQKSVKPEIVYDIDPQFKLLEKIGQGTFGDVYRCQELSSKHYYAVKFEHKDRVGNHSNIEKEHKILQDVIGKPQIPQIVFQWLGADYNYVIMTLCGSNLETIRRQRGMGGLSKHHMLNIAMQMIEAIESFHSCGYVHRDIKPENFAIGIKGDNHTIYLLDFGLSKKYLLDNGEHIPFVEGKNLVGTARFASRNCHKGIDQTRRDDLECIFYLMVYLARGSLPWSNVFCDPKDEKFLRLLDYKENLKIGEICLGMPPVYGQFYDMIKDLGYDEKPQYLKYKKMFFDAYLEIMKEYEWAQVLGRGKFRFTNSCFDWCPDDCTLGEFEMDEYRDRKNSIMGEILRSISQEEDLNKFEEKKKTDEQICVPVFDNILSNFMSIHEQQQQQKNKETSNPVLQTTNQVQ